MRAQTYVEYAKDPFVYHGAGISLDYLHMEAMELFKMGFWSFFDLLNDNQTIDGSIMPDIDTELLDEYEGETIVVDGDEIVVEEEAQA